VPLWLPVLIRTSLVLVWVGLSLDPGGLTLAERDWRSLEALHGFPLVQSP
jgi:hypothetical protein